MLNKYKRFIKDSQGNLVVAGALMLVPVMASFGAAVDYTKFSNQVSSVQQALDSAGLATGRHMSTGANEAALASYSQTYFEANLNSNIDTETIDFSFGLTEGDSSVEPSIPTTITLTATLNYETVFGGLLGVDEMVSDIVSKIALGNRTVEIALVMDNSGSMASNGRLATMQTATKDLVETIFNASALTDLPDPVKFSIVPFAGMVNVGSSNANASWMDTRGWSPIHHENLNWLDTYSTNNPMRDRFYQSTILRGYQEQIDGRWRWKTRFDVYDMMDEDWAGCVEMRPWPHNTMDTVVSRQNFANTYNAMDADGDGTNDGTSALFVPTFAPDEPDNSRASLNGSNTVHYYDDDGYYNSYIYDWENADGQQLWYNYSGGSSEFQAESYNQYGATNQVNRLQWIFKYQGNEVDNNLDGNNGPNYNCKTTAITELTTSEATVDAAIDAMEADGSTNLQQGLTWGWRTLTESEPFTGGRAIDDDQNMKYIILLTDGNNFYGTDGDSTPLNTRYGSWGYAKADQNRWLGGLTSSDLAGTIYQNSSFDMTPESDNDFELIMNAHTNQACRNAKADGVSIFTIAFDVANGSSVKDLLEACSGSGSISGSPVILSGQFYYDVSSGELQTAMANIANQIADMRITQ